MDPLAGRPSSAAVSGVSTDRSGFRVSALVGEVARPVVHQVSFLRGPPPKVIWIRRGNCTTADIEAFLRSSRTEILAFGAEAEAAFPAIS